MSSRTEQGSVYKYPENVLCLDTENTLLLRLMQ